eukprot:NODE_12360_length_1229_cov_4.191470.p1 GENE.NODE_12360_length_1229_cov_4.191470~~NODE_12360_length_1229_cov_4.191470.p1  ORF type:complete len:213 (-),score=50.54 NODE_12360_length_1229_cov_4.191470:197-835(-)
MAARHFAGEPVLDLLIRAENEMLMRTYVGQQSDFLSATLPLEDFTMERVRHIAKCKTSYYSFLWPVKFGMLFAGITNPEAHAAAEKSLVAMGIYFQAQDDYLDAYADPKKLGKIGTDIQDRKLSWLFVSAWELASLEQKAVFEECYGKCKVGSPEEERVKELYNTLGMQRVYEEYESAAYEEILATRADVEAAGLPWNPFETFLSKIFKRTK